MIYPQTPGQPVSPEMQTVDPQRTESDELQAMRDRIAQLEAEAEAREAAAKQADDLKNQGVPEGGAPVEHFHQLADGTFVRGFGTATLIADGDKPPMPVIASYVVPTDYDAHYGTVGR